MDTLQTVTLHTIAICRVTQGGPQNRGHRLMTIILSILNRNFFSPEDFLVNLQLNGYKKFHRTLHMLLHYLAKH